MLSPKGWPAGLVWLALAFLPVSSLPAAAVPSLPTIESRTGAHFDLAGRRVDSPSAAASRAFGRAIPLQEMQSGSGIAPAFASLGLTPSPDGTWSELGPPPRIVGAMAFDSRRGRWVVEGGALGFDRMGPRYSNDTWVFDPAVDRQWRRLETQGTLPPPSAGHRIVYDSARDRILLFGGAHIGFGADGTFQFNYYHDVWALSLADPPTWSHLNVTGGPAVGRTVPGVTYDPVGDRLLVFGGFYYDDSMGSVPPAYGAVYFSDLWELPLASPTAWHLIDPGTGGPSPRDESLLAVDQMGGRLLVIGGEAMTDDPTYPQGTVNLFDLWARPLDGPGPWTLIDVGSDRPSDRYGFSMAWDSARSRAYFYGGVRRNVSLYEESRETWVLDAGQPARWSLAPMAAGTPPATFDAEATVDTHADRFVLFSGGSDIDPRTDTWSFPLDRAGDWTENDPPTSAGDGRIGASAALDDAGHRIVLFGGARPNFDFYYSFLYAGDLRSYDIASGAWTKLDPAGPAPAARAYAASAFDRSHRRWWLVGGEGADRTNGDVWSLDLDGPPRWTAWPLTASGPGPLSGATAIEDPVGRRIVVFGTASLGNPNATWTLDNDAPTAWTLLPTTNDPIARTGHSAVYDSRRRRMIVFGGADPSGAKTAEVDALPLAGPAAWSRLEPGGDAPSARSGQYAAYDSLLDRMLVFGGGVANNYADSATTDAYELRFSDAGPPTWRRLSPGGGLPLGRMDGVGAYDAVQRGIYVAAGWDGFFSMQNDTWRLQLPRPVIEFALAVRPGASAGAAPPGSRAPLPIAFLSQPGFVPATVDVASVRANGVAVLAGGPRAVGRATRDWNGDNVPDRLVWFDGASVRAQSTDGAIDLTGALLDGTPIHASAVLELRTGGHDAADAGDPLVAIAPIALALVRMERGGAGGLRVSFTAPGAGSYAVTLHDVRGRRVASAEGECGAGGQVTVSLSATVRLAPGIYFGQVRMGGAVATGRLVLLPAGSGR